MSTPFDPVEVDTTQSDQDKANVSAALAWLRSIDALAEAHLVGDNAYLAVVQRLQLPIDNNAQLVVAKDKYHQLDVLGASSTWRGTVTGWGKGIQSMRVIAAYPQNLDNEEVQGRLVFPPTPQLLADFAVKNRLSHLKIVEL